MFGSASEPGIVPRAVNDLFEHLTSHSRNKDVACMVYLSYVELYNNYFYDLLAGSTDASGDRISIHDSTSFRGVYLTGSSHLRTHVSSAEDVREYFCV